MYAIPPKHTMPAWHGYIYHRLTITYLPTHTIAPCACTDVPAAAVGNRRQQQQQEEARGVVDYEEFYNQVKELVDRRAAA